MTNWRQLMKTILLSLVMTTLPAQLVFAHLMVAQHGTLNIVDDSVFMVLSLPVSAFEGLDDDPAGGQISQLTVMGRFALATADSSLRFHVGLFGKAKTEQTLEITATRDRDQYTAVRQLTPASPAVDI